MEKIAFVIGNTFLYWNSIILAMAVGTAILFFLAFYLDRGGRGGAAAAAISLAVVFSLVLARFCHWYSRSDAYDSFLSAMTDYTRGGYALMGVFAGCLLAAGLCRLARLDMEILRLLDAMCMGGGAGIAVGRLACFYSAADRGQILQSMKSLPWAYPVVNAVSGAAEYRLATFVIQAMVTGAIFLGLAAFSRSKGRKTGDLTWLFLLLYGAGQAVLDSTRYDSLYFRSNGFVSIVQILGAVSVLAMSVIFALKLCKARGFRGWYAAVWTAMAALLGCAGYMEYYVQRHGDRAVFAYSVMSICLLLICIADVAAYAFSRARD